MYQQEKIVKIALKTLFLQMRMRSVSKLFECRWSEVFVCNVQHTIFPLQLVTWSTDLHKANALCVQQR